MDTEEVKMFTVLATKLSYTETAKAFDISQPTLSRKIQSLEKSLGVRLFHRLGRTVALTPQGQSFLESAQQINALIDHSIERLNIERRGISGLLKIGCLHPMARFMTHHFLPEFQERYPEISIYLHTLTPSDLSSFEDVDIMIAPFAPSSDNVVSRKIEDYRRYCYATPAYLEKRGVPKHIHDLELHQCITQTNSLNNERHWLLENANGQTVSVKVSGRNMTNSIDIARDLTKQNFGIGLLPEDQVRKEVEGGDLIQLFKGDWFVDDAIYVLYKPNTQTPRRYQVFIEEFEKFNKEWS